MIQPLNENIVIIPDKKPESIGGIYIPETTKKQPETGVVFKSKDDNIKEGMAVLFRKYGATTVTIDRDEFLIVPKEDILAIIED